MVMAKRIYKRLYCGYRKNESGMRDMVIFRSATMPTNESHGDLYAAVVGPFRTKAGAEWMADPIKGRMNPHCRCVNDAERLAKKYAIPRRLAA